MERCWRRGAVDPQERRTAPVRRDCQGAVKTPSPAMDEHAGPGVFFNNNSTPVLSAGGPGAAAGGGGGEPGREQYSIPGILHFLQHEWARFELERAQWEVERAELQVSTPEPGTKTAPFFFLFSPVLTLSEPGAPGCF